MDLNTRELPELWRPPIVEHAAGENRYLLAWGDDTDGVRWGFLLWPPQARGETRWVRWEEIRPVAGEDYSAVPVADPLM
ncbi:hypothetical protein ACFOY2_04095 [Nonomuraea purpurea]|uniref:Uncharacterized protein n=1 Tax=Nonomuraea purpurea TaxID=1849276 RepID=A0ABV8FY43_9ACTN